MKEDLMDASQASGFLGVDMRGLYDLIQEGDLEIVDYHGDVPLFSALEVRDLFAKVNYA